MIRRLLKTWLTYRPLDLTRAVRDQLKRPELAGMPVCPVDEGDLLFQLIRNNDCLHCLETGFGTGSTALYMLSAQSAPEASVISIDWSPKAFNQLGRNTIDHSGMTARHTHIETVSQKALAGMMLAGRRFDFILFDGWRRSDHLLYETYLMNQLLEAGGIFFMDDAVRPAYRQSARLVTEIYGYQEIDYAAYGLGWQNRLYHILTRRHLTRPFRAFRKQTDTPDSFHE
ncbi:MAG: class I SAM-dependent methyltransferase [Rhodospirillales bacterium]